LKENKLIQRCQQGERVAQRLLFDEYYKYVYTISFRYLQHHQDAQDVVSVVFRRIFDNIMKIQDTANHGLKRWIQTIAINESLRFLKHIQPINYTADQNLLDSSIEQEESITELDIKIVKQAVNELPTGYRTIFLLNVVEGLSHSEIAEHLGISRNTSKSQMLKARKYLQNKLRKNESRQV